MKNKHGSLIERLGGFKTKKNGKKERVLFRKERAENEEKNGFSEEGGFKIKKKNSDFCVVNSKDLFENLKIRSKFQVFLTVRGC